MLFNYGFLIDIFVGRWRDDYYLVNSEMTLDKKTNTIRYVPKKIESVVWEGIRVNFFPSAPLVSAKIEKFKELLEKK